MGGTPSYHQVIIHLNRIFHCKPSSYWGYHYFRKPPFFGQLLMLTAANSLRRGESHRDLVGLLASFRVACCCYKKERQQKHINMQQQQAVNSDNRT